MAPKPVLLRRPEVTAQMASSLKGGLYLADALTLAGVSETRHYAWVEQGEAIQAKVDAAEAEGKDLKLSAADEAYRVYSEAIKRAAAESEANALQIIRDAATDTTYADDEGKMHTRWGTWQAAAWYLERRYPRKWGRFDRVEQTQPTGMTPKDLEEIDLEREDVRDAVNGLIHTLSAAPGSKPEPRRSSPSK